MPAQIIRIKLRHSTFVDGLIDNVAPLVDGEGATPPTFTQGAAVDFELGFHNSAGDAVQSWTGVESVTIAILEPGAGGRSYYQSTQAIAALGTSITKAQWDAGTHEHATWSLTSAQANIPTLSEARPLVLTSWATTEPDGSGNRQRVFLGGGYLQMIDPGLGGDIATQDPLPYPAVTMGELAAAAAAILADLDAVTHITGSAPTDLADARGVAGSSIMIASGWLYVRSSAGWAKIATTALPEA